MSGLVQTWTHSYQSWRTRSSRLRGAGTVYDVSPREARRWVAVDVVAVVALLALATLAQVELYATGWLWVAGLGGAVLGVGTGVVSLWRRWPAWITAVAVAVTYLVTGSALAMPQLATWSVVPNLRTVSGLVLGTVQVWRRVLTMDAPIGLTDNLLVMPLLTMMLAGVAAITIATRSGRPGLAWLPPAAAVVIGIAFGLQTTVLPVPLGVAFVVVVLVWTAHRRDQQRQTLLARRRRFNLRTVASAAGVLVVAGLVAALLAPMLTPANRAVLRDAVQPPLDVRQWPSPLQAYRANIKDHRTEVLFTVEGLPAGVPIRIATLDAYDGITYNASSAVPGAGDAGIFKRIGSRIPDDTAGVRVDYAVSIGAYRDRWLPTLGQARTVAFTSARGQELAEQFFYNRSTGTGVDVTPLQSGDSYRVEAVVATQPIHSELATARVARTSLPAAGPVPEELGAKAREWTTGVTSDGEAAIRLETELRKGFYSNGTASEVPSLSGHGGYRMALLMTDHQGRMVGDEEQYAVAMALMARELGMPARVVYGYRPSGSGTVAVTGNDAAAWVEINFEKFGWVEFEPTPDRSKSLPLDTTRTESKPRPQVENPPPPPERPDQAPPDNTPPLPSDRPDDDEGMIDWELVRTLALVIGIPLVLVVVPVVTVLALKSRRRRRRRHAGEPGDQIAAGWSELLDRARDLGGATSRRATRVENAAALVAAFPTSGSSVSPATLARRADWVTFSGSQADPGMVEQYWQSVRASVTSLGEAVPWWRRWLAAISPASLLPSWVRRS